MLMKILARFLTKKQLRYIELNPHKVEMAIKSYIPGLAIFCILIILSLLIYGMYTFLIVMNLLITILVLWGIFNRLYNSEDGEHTPDLVFACSYGVVCLIVLLFVLTGSVSFVHNIVFNS